MTTSDADTDVKLNIYFYSHTIEISTLGFISNINDFIKLIGVCHMPIHVKQEIISTVLKSSFAIYSNWNNAAMINDA